MCKNIQVDIINIINFKIINYALAKLLFNAFYHFNRAISELSYETQLFRQKKLHAITPKVLIAWKKSFKEE